jgi:hypothetical protein
MRSPTQKDRYDVTDSPYDFIRLSLELSVFPVEMALAEGTNLFPLILHSLYIGVRGLGLLVRIMASIFTSITPFVA